MEEEVEFTAIDVSTEDVSLMLEDQAIGDTEVVPVIEQDTGTLSAADQLAIPEPKNETEVAPIRVYTLEYAPFTKGWFVNPMLLFQLIGASVALFIFAWLYIGAAWDPASRLATLEVAVLSCDSGVPAPLINVLPHYISTYPLGLVVLESSVLNSSSAIGSILGWKLFYCDCVSSTPRICRENLILSVNQGEVWSALYIPEDFTTSILSNAPSLGLTKHQATIEHIYGAGRSSSTYNFIKSVVSATVNGISMSLGQKMLQTPSLAAAVNPSFYLSPVKLIDTNLHPVVHFEQHFSSYVICVLLWMGSAFTVSVIS